MRRNAPHTPKAPHGPDCPNGPPDKPDKPDKPDEPDRTGSPGTPGTTPDVVLQARALFPRGLAQPVGGFRFSVDALLLAAFAGECLPEGNALAVRAENLRDERSTTPHAQPMSGQGAAQGASPGIAGMAGMTTFADLGAGCGVVGLALLLAHPHLTGTGIDIDGELADAARQNAARLGLADRFRVLRADLTATGSDGCKDERNISGMPEAREFTKAANLPDPALAFDALPRAASMDLVVANPPYRRHGSGRPSPSSQRTRALFETPETLPAFTRAAARLLRARGRSCWVYGPDRLPDLLLALRATGQEPARLRCVHARAHGPATLVLVEARRAGKPGLVVEPPLILHAGEGAATALTDEALTFCPLLACNARGKGR
ncbi:tRNA1(Val) (adenine(37)-N6)-methyltransferase [Nitratidesulfovibrio termitidis]|uniref:tRNA1(Val) (adenine(37)-N6)-methyltransferase n=1 Tax=Nitratidesulfovibrio termitidis TaxID=42252 RepID=UPI00040AA0EF|nr:methyltransferase [Nitratidesulfovibrio termitidis]